MYLELKHNVSFSKNSNEMDIEKNPKITDDVTQKHEIDDTLKVGANLGLLYFLAKSEKAYW